MNAANAPDGTLVVDTELPVAASASAVWAFLTRADGRRMRDIVQGSAGLEREDTDLTRVGHVFTEFFTDPDSQARVPCVWRTVAKSDAEWHLVAEDFLHAGLTIDLVYSLKPAPDGSVHLRRRMRTHVPRSVRLTPGWRVRLGNQDLADEVTRRVAAAVPTTTGP